MITTLVSAGRTGAETGALSAGAGLGLRTYGYTFAGPTLRARFNLTLAPLGMGPLDVMEMNVAVADAVVVLGNLDDYTLAVITLCKEMGRLHLHVNEYQSASSEARFLAWGIMSRLYITGNVERESPGIDAAAERFVKNTLGVKA